MSASPDNLRRHADIIDMQARCDAARAECLAEESWLDGCGAVMGHTRDGLPAGMLALPTPDTLTLWGLRWAFELAATQGDPDCIRDTNARFMGLIGGGSGGMEHVAMAAMAALAEMAETVLPNAVGMDDPGELPVVALDSARNAWTIRAGGAA